MNFLKNVVLFGVLTALCIAVPTNTITDQAVDPLNFNRKYLSILCCGQINLVYSD